MINSLITISSEAALLRNHHRGRDCVIVLSGLSMWNPVSFALSNTPHCSADTNIATLHNPPPCMVALDRGFGSAVHIALCGFWCRKATRADNWEIEIIWGRLFANSAFPGVDHSSS